jgi:hypothetical protein
MMPPVLTTSSQALCMHGGQVQLITTNGTLFAGGSPVLLQTDMHVVVGCPFTVGVDYSPCVRVQWEAAATSLTVDGAGVLLQTSIGICLNAAGAPQGTAIVSAPAPTLEAI